MQVSIDTTVVSFTSESFIVDDFIRDRSTSAFTIVDTAGTASYVKGQTVEILDDNEALLFAGYIDTVKSEYLVGGDGVMVHAITCKDQHYLADKRIVAHAWENQTTHTIVDELITDYLADEGVTVGQIDAGVTLTKCVFNYIPVTQALELLAEKSGYIWYIDYDKKLYFMVATTVPAPWIVTTNDMLAKSVKVDKSNAMYRNKQYVKAATDLADAQTESFKGDGSQTTFAVAMNIGAEPTITVNSVSKTVGIRQLETGHDWYWSKGEKTISQDSGGTKLTSSDTLAITYQGQFNIVVVTENLDEISTRQDIEGGTGIVEDVYTDNSLTNMDDAFSAAQAKLTRYALDSSKLSFITQRNGLRAGQMAHVEVSEYSIDQDMLVEIVSTTIYQGQMFYEVTLTYGSENQGWAKMFDRIINNSNAYSIMGDITEDETLITQYNFSKTWLESTPNNIWHDTLLAGATTYCGTSVYPEFDPDQRVLYTELLTSGDVVLCRKAVLKHSGTTTLVSTTYFNGSEGNGTIAKIRWYGGSSATSTNGSGVLVDEQAWAITKTSLDSFQVIKTDIKGYPVPSATATAVMNVPSIIIT